MPIVTGGNSVQITFEGNSDDLIKASNDAIKAIEKNKEAVKRASKEIEAAAKKEQEAIKKTAAQYSGSLAPGLQKAQDAVSKFMSANTALIGVTVAVGAAAVKSYQAFQQYAGSVRDVALASGASAEQASLFLQVLDDFEVSAQDVGTSMRAMTKNGLTPTLDTLAKLADQYVAIQDPMQKNKFLLDNLGKSGLSWANALSQGGDALRANAEEVNKNLILTDEQIKKAEQARLAVDALSDAWEGAKVAAGGAVGGLIILNQQMTDYQDETGKAAQQNGILTEEFKKWQQVTQSAQTDQERLNRALEKGAAMTKFYGGTVRDTAADLEELSKTNADLIKDAISIQDANDKYNESQQETLDKIAELQAKKEELYPWERDEISKINDQINEQKEKYAEGAKAFGEAQGEKLVMLALEQIALQDGVAGYSEAEAAKAKILLDTAGIAEESAFRQALAFDQASQALAKGTMAAEELHDLLRMMSEHGWTIDVAVRVQNDIANGAAMMGASAAQQSVGWQGGQWAGGTVGSFANGGKAGGWGLVGDKQGGGFIPGVSELIFGNARVFNSRESEKMLKSGMFGKIPGFAGGGMTAVKGAKKPWGASLTGGGGGSSESLSSISSMPETQAVSNEIAAQVAAQVEVSMQTVVAGMMSAFTQSLDNGFETLGSIMRTDNPRAVGKYTAAAFVQTQV